MVICTTISSVICAAIALTYRVIGLNFEELDECGVNTRYCKLTCLTVQSLLFAWIHFLIIAEYVQLLCVMLDWCCTSESVQDLYVHKFATLLRTGYL